jgi:hypothetical protein
VIGEAGLGKSTLIAELKKTNDGFTWLRGDAVSYARSVSYFTWRQIIRQSIEAHEDDAPSDVRHKLSYVCDCCTLPGGDIPFLEAMLAVESEESLQICGIRAALVKNGGCCAGYLRAGRRRCCV